MRYIKIVRHRYSYYYYYFYEFWLQKYLIFETEFAIPSASVKISFCNSYNNLDEMAFIIPILGTQKLNLHR